MKIKFNEPPPQASDGWHTETVADVIDAGQMKSEFGGRTVTRDKLKLRGFLDEVDPETGKQITIDSLYTASVHPKSKFYKLVKIITGSEPKRNATGLFDCDSLLNRTFLCETERKSTATGTWARVIAVKAAPPGTQPVAVPLNYKREKEKLQSTGTKVNGFAAETDTSTTDDEVLAFPGADG